MYLFQRTVTLRGGARRPAAWAVEVNQFVNANMGVEVSLWSSLFGMPLGTFVWSARVDSLDQWTREMGGLMGNAAYHDLVERGQEWVAAPGEDSFRQLIHAEAPSPAAPPVGALATAVTATPSQGNMAKALGWGVEIAGTFARATGGSISVFADAYGTFGQITWIAIQPDPAGVDAATAALQASPDYLSSVDAAGALFVPGSGRQALFRRIA